MPDVTAGPEAGSPASGSWPIRLTDVTVRYPNGVMGLRGVSLAVEPGEMVSVVGLSGSGKSTLIRTINGLVPATSGTVQVGPYTVNELGGRRLRHVRGGIGMIFQGFNLADRASIYHNVLVGRFSHTRPGRPCSAWPAARTARS